MTPSRALALFRSILSRGGEPDLPHEGLRPLSPYGEGYCRWCRFVVGLGPDGMLEPHSRGEECAGGGTRPPKVTPYSSKRSRFGTVQRKAFCYVCEQEVPLLGDGALKSHRPDPYNFKSWCEGGNAMPRG